MWWTGTRGLSWTKAMALAAWTPDEQAPDEPRPPGDRHSAEVGKCDAGFGHRLTNDRADVLEVVPGRELGHDTTVGSMEGHLGQR